MLAANPRLNLILTSLSNVLELLVDDADVLRIEVFGGETSDSTLRVSAKQTDIGKLIGQQGRTARSLRILLMEMTSSLNIKVTLDINTIS